MELFDIGIDREEIEALLDFDDLRTSRVSKGKDLLPMEINHEKRKGLFNIENFICG